ncbi:hypothetical protein NP493_896g00035 [Ridgeia piscesae]|uniref:Uncharacterized protein n=1 Tax=Ridgeia piscesae TaxID=27915 RepID=A0AAD9KKB9_RIDPI|nr:hypothetical protein NP493_896g00035 [Ridgeia piscesae]
MIKFKFKFKGRLSFRQYLPSKPIKWGIKMWALYLRVRGILACGTVGVNRKGLPTTLLPKNVRLQRGELDGHDPTEQGTVLRRREQARTQVPVPKMLEDYNNTCGEWTCWTRPSATTR